MLNLALHPRRVAMVGIIAASLLVALYAATQYYRVKIASPRLEAASKLESWPKTEGAALSARERIVNPRGIVKMFDMDAEGNVPAIWSVVQLIAAAVLLLVIAKHCKVVGTSAWPWLILGIGFLFLALDEGGSIHSSFYLSQSTEASRKARGIFYYSWIIPALIAVAVVGLVYLRFLWKLPARTRVLFIVAGVWYVGSALGGEMAQGWWNSQGLSKVRLSWAALTILEEMGEMLSIALFIAALLDYMCRQSIAVTVSVVGNARPAVMQAKSSPVKHPEPSLADVDDDAELLAH